MLTHMAFSIFQQRKTTLLALSRPRLVCSRSLPSGAWNVAA
jgi:hypothetical protein